MVADETGVDELGCYPYKMSDHLTLSLTIHWGCPLGFERLFCCNIWLCSDHVDRYTHSDCQPQCHQVSCHVLKLSCEEPLSTHHVCDVRGEGVCVKREENG